MILVTMKRRVFVVDLGGHQFEEDGAGIRLFGEGLPPLPGRSRYYVLDRGLTPPANFRQASGLASAEGEA